MNTNGNQLARREFVEEVLGHITPKLHDHRKLRYINSGGCCIFAVIMAKYLKALGLEPAIRVSDSKWDHPDFARGVSRARKEAVEAITNIDFKSYFADKLGFYHVWIEIELEGRTYWFDAMDITVPTKRHDGDAIPSMPGHGVFHETMTWDEAATCASAPTWNPTFDRTSVPHLEKIVQRAFIKVCKQNNVPVPEVVTPFMPAGDE